VEETWESENDNDNGDKNEQWQWQFHSKIPTEESALGGEKAAGENNRHCLQQL
jgi:hypothetical protein